MRRQHNENSGGSRGSNTSIASPISSLGPAEPKKRSRFGRWRFSGFRKSQDGAAAIEFAILLPVFVVMIGAILQFGAAMFVQNQMVNVARETARDLAIGDITEAQAVTQAQAALSALGTGYVVTATNIPANSDVTVTITIPLNQATVVSVVDILDSYNLTASVSVRK